MNSVLIKQSWMDQNTLNMKLYFHMITGCYFFKLLVLAFLFTVLATGPALTKESQLTESYIAFQTSRTSGDKFYRIMVNDEECPYLDLKNIINHHLDLNGNFDIENKKSSVDIFVKGGNYWIDGVSNTFGFTLKDGKTEKKFEKNYLLIHENKFWIRYDLLASWLPVKIIWELDRYYMRFLPQFPLKKEIMAQRKRTRDNDRQNLIDKKRKDAIRPIEPSDNFNTELRIKLNHATTDDDDNDDIVNNSYIALDLNSDIYKGTFKLNTLITKNSGDDTESQFNWKYKREDQKYFDLFEIGNIYNSSSLLNPTIIVQNGINIKKLPKNEGRSGFNFSGITQPGTEIDIYINGFISGTKKTTDGKYNFENFQASGGEVVMLKFYFSDGSSKVEMYQISSDAGKLIPEGEWDYQCFAGEEDDDDENEIIGFVNLRYGLFDNFTLGTYSYKYPETTLNGLDLTWKPYPGLFIISEHMFSEGTMGNALVIEGNYPPNNYRAEVKFIDEESPIISLQSSEKEYPEYCFLRYTRNSGGWYISLQYTDTTGYIKYQSTIKKKINKYLSVSTENSLKTYKDGLTDDIESNIIGTDIMYNKHNIRLRWSLDTYQNISYRYQPGRYAKYYWSASYNRYENNDDWDLFFSFNYKFGDFLSTQTSVSDSYRKVEATFEGIIANEKGPEKSDQFAMGTLYGVLKTPGDDKHPETPIEGATIVAGSKRTTTDKDGKYVINGLPVNQKIVFKILPSSMEVGLTPKEEYSIFKFRPGTSIEHNPIVQRTIGIDGVVLFDGDINEGAKITALHIKSNREIATAEVDPDGFFVIEGIVPGFYHFVIKGVKKKDFIFKYMVEGKEDWISELKIEMK